MQLGMPTLIELDRLEACAAHCRLLGLDFVELNMNLPQFQPERMDEQALRQIASEHGIGYTLHLDENCSPCDFNDAVAAAHAKTVMQAISLAKQLQIPTITMHLPCGVWFTLPGQKVFLFDLYQETYFQKLRSFRDACTEAIGDAGIKVCIENSSGYDLAPFLSESLACLLQSDAFALTFDVGHAALTNFADEAMVLRQVDRLHHMHLHDASIEAGLDHLPLGQGNLDLPRYLLLARDHVERVVIEVKTLKGLQESVQWLQSMHDG